MKKLTYTAWIIFILTLFGYFIFRVAKRYNTDHITKSNLQYTKAVIIDSRIYNGYSFTINGKSYTGNSHDQIFKVGDSTEIEYDKTNPELNRPLHPKD